MDGGQLEVINDKYGKWMSAENFIQYIALCVNKVIYFWKERFHSLNFRDLENLCKG